VVNSILASYINSAQRAILELKPIGRTSIPDEIRRFGAANVNCAVLTNDDIQVLLRQMDDVDVLRGLHIHRILTDSTRMAIQPDCYWADGSFVVNDVQLLRQVRLLQLSDDPVLAARQRQIWPAIWSPHSAIALVSTQPRPAAHFLAMLDALCGASKDDKVARYQQVTSLAWLPMQDGKAVAPRDVIYWPEYGGSLDELVPADSSVRHAGRSRTGSFAQLAIG
jgi:hypothetical protein